MQILHDKPIVDGRFSTELVALIRSQASKDPFRHDPITAEVKSEDTRGNGGVVLETDSSKPNQVCLILTGIVFEKGMLADFFFGDYINRADIMSALSKAEGEFDTILLKIDSYGGMVSEGNAIMNYLKDRPETINTEVLSEAASMAGVIFMLGEKRSVHENASHIMIHEASSIWGGRANDFDVAAKRLRDLNEAMASTYAGKSKETKNWYLQEMSLSVSGRWFTAEEAISRGIATDLITQDVGKSDEEKNTLAQNKKSDYNQENSVGTEDDDQFVPECDI